MSAPSLEAAWAAFAAAARREARASETRDATAFPHYSEQGRWLLLPAETRSAWNGATYEHGNWTFGFWFGVMWLLALDGDEAAADLARERIGAVVERSADTTTHDLGFVVWPSLVLGDLLGRLDPGLQAHALTAARVLVDRFNAAGGYIQAFGPTRDPRSAGTSTIDTMMNLPLLWWAADRHGDADAGAVARQHASRSRAFLRPDGSTYHLLGYDPESGALVRRGTFQGAGDASCWSRGQAWAIAGQAIAHGVTGDADLLVAAERAAAWFWARLPADGVPPWDFGAGAEAPRDASAAAIAALGALVLAEVHPDAAARDAHRARATALLARLDASCVNRSPGTDGILLRSAYSVPHGLGVDGATGWGDFYYGLALAIATGRASASALFGLQPHRA
jgi:unsaturated chondroitin disaccharide hydrolase